MSFDLTVDEGTYLVRLARRAIETRLKRGETVEALDGTEKLKAPCGVFVTLNRVEGKGHSLRGCIGFPLPVKPLIEAVIDSAISAAINDPRFNPVSASEMDAITIEVSVLTPPKVIRVDSPEEYPKEIEVGRDGLIVRRGRYQGLLLPQVPVEWGWDAEEFLSQCCLKAWLPPDAWLMKETEVSKFQAIIFAEKSPKGIVNRVNLG